MITLLVSAILGFVYVEMRNVRRGMRKDGTCFDVGYYLLDNWVELVLNAIGTAILLVMAPAVTHYLRYTASRWIAGVPDEALADGVLAPVTGAAIGLIGAMFVRWVVKKGEAWFGGAS